jgi:tripeptidyl-peptidase-1
MNILQAVVLVLAAGFVQAERTVMEPSISNFDHPTWNQGARVSDDDTMEVTFIVKTCPHFRAKLEETFWAVSDPKGPDYKKYLKLDEIADMLHPLPTEEARAEGKKSTVEYVTEFLNNQTGLVHDNNIRVTRTRDMVTATLNAKSAETFFDTELYHFFPKEESLRTVDKIRATAPYSLPDTLAAKVALVDKLIRLPVFTPPKVDRSVPNLRRGVSDDEDPFSTCSATLCREATTPAVVRERYGFPVLSSYTDGNSMACAEFQGQGIVSTDLSNFATTCDVSHVKVDNTEGAGGGFKAGVEASLDVEYIEAVAAPIPLTVINSLEYSIFDWAENLNNADDPAWVQSVSYGNDEVQQTSVEYMEECNQQFQMNGARGLSVIIASGDQGVWGRTGRTADNVFHPAFPASSPYITAVGGTQFLETSVMGEETTWEDGGGGFSNTFTMPDYQTEIVAAYLSSGVDLPDAYQYNSSGRAYPDVSALAGTANGYCVASGGSFMKVGGTSAATPVFAGGIAQLNDQLLAAGEAPMGFLNQWIYGVAGPAGVFQDVTTGTNNEGTGNGFTATTGWDPATGFGTPDFVAMQKLVMGN